MRRQRLAALGLARGGANGDFVTLVFGNLAEDKRQLYIGDDSTSSQIGNPTKDYI